MNYSFYSIVENDFQDVNDLIINRLFSQVTLVEEISNYLVKAGGKRLRPLLVLLSTKALDYADNKHINLAAVIEFLHTAMLLHDDVVDDSSMRRGRKTVNAAWGNPASVLVGDFLHSRAFEMMVEIGDMRVMEILAHATNTIAQGEVNQLANIGNANLSEASYMEVIRAKTAMLFEAASHSGAVLARASATQESALKDYGLHLGQAFQLVDDALDYEGDAANLGKNVGDDLAEGKVTLPLIYAMRTGTAAETDLIRKAVTEGGLQHLQEVLSTVRSTGAIKYTMSQAAAQGDKAIECLDHLPDSPYRKEMYNLVRFSLDRSF